VPNVAGWRPLAVARLGQAALPWWRWMVSFLKVLGYARRLFWFLELLVDPEQAAAALLEHPRVRRWLEKQPAEDQEKIRQAAPLVMGALLAAVD